MRIALVSCGTRGDVQPMEIATAIRGTDGVELTVRAVESIGM